MWYKILWSACNFDAHLGRSVANIFNKIACPSVQSYNNKTLWAVFLTYFIIKSYLFKIHIEVFHSKSWFMLCLHLSFKWSWLLILKNWVCVDRTFFVQNHLIYLPSLTDSPVSFCTLVYRSAFTEYIQSNDTVLKRKGKKWINCYCRKSWFEISQIALSTGKSN
jgi:hypothetical protein